MAPAAEVASFKQAKFHPSAPSFIKLQADNDDDDYNGRTPSVYDVQKGGEGRGEGCEDSDRVITSLFTDPGYHLPARGGGRGEGGGEGGGLIKSDTLLQSYMCS